MKRHLFLLGGLLVTLACEAPVTSPLDLAPSYATNLTGFRFVDNDWGTDITGEVVVREGNLYLMNLVAGDSKGVVKNPSVVWTTSDIETATVSATKGRAVVRLLKPGYVTIRANLGTAEATATFHVLGMPHHYVVSASPGSPVVGTTTVVSAQLVDGTGQPLQQSGRIVTWSATNGGTLAASTSTTDANGVATVGFTVGTSTAVAHEVTATDEDLLAGSGSITPQAGAPATVTLTLVSTSFAAGSAVPVFVTVRDAYGNPAANTKVKWNWIGDLTCLTPNPDFADDQGRLLGVFQTPAAPGTFRVRALAGDAKLLSDPITTF